ncbi:MAG: hypothetical protein JXQ29_02740 [Planctomycetes bacterium]|nr:hypothetical protein [Planctomycetota bacterium]
MFAAGPIVAAILSLAQAEAASPPPAPLDCRVEVRIRDVPEDGADRAGLQEVLLDQAVFPVQEGAGHYEAGTRVPVTTYSWKSDGWTAGTSFQTVGNRVALKSLCRGPDGSWILSYECEVTAVLTVVGATPIIGSVQWQGTAVLPAGAPLVLAGRCRVHALQLRLPSQHPEFDPEKRSPAHDLVKEITLRVDIASAPPPDR